MDGHELHEEDLRLMYTFNQASGSAAQYEAHSDSQVCFEPERCSFHFQHKRCASAVTTFIKHFFLFSLIHYFLTFGPFGLQVM